MFKMRNWITSLVFVAVLGGLGQAFAQESNLLGLYFDPFAEMDCIEASSLPQYSSVDLYVILENPTFEELWGFEFSMFIEGPALVTGWYYPHGIPGFNFGEDGNYVVGLGNPLPMDELNILMAFHIFYMSPSFEEICFILGPSVPSSLDPLYPTFAYSEDGLVSASVNNGIEGDCTALISDASCNVVPTDTQTWDSLKSLYR